MTIDEYIAAQDPAVAERLQRVRETIAAALPGAEERFAWNMPTFWRGKNLIHFAAAKHHIGIYPGSEAVEAFASELSDFKTSKGTIQLPHDKPLPLELIGRIAAWCDDRYGKPTA